MIQAGKSIIATCIASCLTVSGCQAARGYVDAAALVTSGGLMALLWLLIEVTRAVRR